MLTINSKLWLTLYTYTTEIMIFMASLWNMAGHYIFVLWFLLSVYLLSSFFLAYFQPSQTGCLPYFHTWCGLCSNLGCRSETCCTRLAENTRCKKIAKNSASGHHHTTLSGSVFATKTCIDNQKKLVKQQYLPLMSLQYGEPTSGWDLLVSLGYPSKFQRVSRLVLAALLHGIVVVGVSQTLQHWTDGATLFGRVAITLGIGPHSSLVLGCCLLECSNFSWANYSSLWESSVMAVDYQMQVCQLGIEILIQWPPNTSPKAALSSEFTVVNEYIIVIQLIYYAITKFTRGMSWCC